MSSILNALKKVEGAGPEVAGPRPMRHVLEPPPARRRVRPLHWAALAGGLAVVAGAAVYSLMPSEGHAPEPAGNRTVQAQLPQTTAPPPMAKSTPARETRETPAFATVPAPEPTPAPALQPKPAPVPEPPATAAAAPAPSAPPIARAPSTPAEAVDPGPPVQAPPPSARIRPPREAAAPAPDARPAVAARPAPAPAAPAPVRPTPPAPAARSPEDSLGKLEESKLKVMAIAWAEDPARRIAVVNGRIVKEGESVDGYSVTRIRQGDLVVSDGSRSWRVELNLRPQ